MSAIIRKIPFQEYEIEIDLADNHLMYNATQMAQIYGEEPSLYLNTPDAKNVITVHLESEDFYQYVKLNTAIPSEVTSANRLDLIVKVVNGTTWVNHFLAVRLASFLCSAPLELWVMDVRFDLLTEIRGRRSFHSK